jgi:cobalt-precorrin-5B (C1)-methyltransferase
VKAKKLREGFTTGTAAAAAAKAAVLCLAGAAVPAAMDVPLPAGGRLGVPLAGMTLLPDGRALGTVVKDGGDDPDVTDGARIEALVRLTPDRRTVISLHGGTGVGRVTRPGLPVPVGRAAINPSPRAQIKAAVAEALAACGVTARVRVSLRVPEGERLAEKTMNPRLGIVGGISILGTRGTVKPFSLEAWQATVSEALSVARAEGADTAYLSTGGRSEKALKALFPEAPATAFVQAADHFAHAMAETGRLGFARAVWGVFPGKLVKQATGSASTHAHAGHLDLAFLAGICRDCGLAEPLAAAVTAANTAQEAMEIIAPTPALAPVLAVLARRAAAAAGAFGGASLRVAYRVFDLRGRLLHASDPEQP